MKKFIITTVVVLFLGGGLVGWWYMFYRMDAMLVAEIQRKGSEAFGTQVTVGDIDVDLLDGAMRIDELAIGNPPGFSREHAVVFGSIEAELDYSTGEVERVVLEGARIYIEEHRGETNVQRLKDALESRIGGAGGSRHSGSGDEIVIRRFLMRSTTATFESASLKRLSEVEIDEIEMHDLRGTPEFVSEKIAREVIEEIAEEAGRAMLQAQAEKQIDELTDKASEKLKEWLGTDDQE
ncbi:MAG: hypothetical protein R3212_06735 [Xanthomonadales bacterium]|nr:hypothetical protein [Xanthomonadales bacterium]